MHKGKIIMDDSPVNIFEKKSKQLIKVGLGLPQVTKCMHELKSKGKDVFTGVLTVQDARNEIMRKVNKNKKKQIV
jgi:energy-coupling factor transport system ATP-binding protein